MHNFLTQPNGHLILWQAPLFIMVSVGEHATDLESWDLVDSPLYNFVKFSTEPSRYRLSGWILFW